MRIRIEHMAVGLGLMLFLAACEEKQGCTDPLADNYDSDAKVDDGSCQYPLTACFTVSNPFPTEDQSIQFAAGCSKSAAAYNWNFGDGSGEVQGVNVSHTYTVPGTYTVRLTVSDNVNFHSTEQTVTIAGTYSKVTLNQLTLNRFPWYDSNGNLWDQSWEGNTGANTGMPEVYIEVRELGGSVIYSNAGDVQMMWGVSSPDWVQVLTWNLNNAVITDLNKQYVIVFIDVDPAQLWEMAFYGPFTFLDQGIFGSYPNQVSLSKSVNSGAATMSFNLNMTWGS